MTKEVSMKSGGVDSIIQIINIWQARIDADKRKHRITDVICLIEFMICFIFLKMGMGNPLHMNPLHRTNLEIQRDILDGI